MGGGGGRLKGEGVCQRYMTDEDGCKEEKGEAQLANKPGRRGGGWRKGVVVPI